MRQFNITVPILSALLTLPLLSQMPPSVNAQINLMQMQRQMDQMMFSRRSPRWEAAKRVRQAVLAGHKSAPNAQAILPKPTKEIWVGPTIVSENLEPCLDGSAFLAVAKKPWRMLMLERTTGKVRWEQPLETSRDFGPVMLDDQIFYVMKDGNGVLLDAASGKQRRSVALEAYDTFVMRPKKDYHRYLPPVLSKGRLVVASYGKGKLSGSLEGKVQAFDVATGAKAWELEIPYGPDLMPVVLGTRVIVGGGGKVMGLETATGKVTWTTSVGSGNGTAKLDLGFQEGNRLVLICEKMRIALDASTGKELWREKVQGEACSTLTGEGDRVLHLEARGFFVGSTWLVALDAATGKTAWERKVDQNCFPWAQDGAVLIKDKDSLLLLDLKDGKPRWSLPMSATPTNPLIPEEGVVYITYQENTGINEPDQCVLQAQSLKDGQPLWRHVPKTPYARGFIHQDETGLVYIGEGGKVVRVE